MERYAADLYGSTSKIVDVTLLKWAGSKIFLIVVIPYFFVRSIWILTTKQIDIIHMQDGVMSFMGAVLKFIFRKPLVVVIHGLDVTFDNPVFRATILRTLRRADRIISISRAAADAAVATGVDRDKISVIPLGVTDDLYTGDRKHSRKHILAELSLDSDARILLSVGRLVERKGVHWFIEEVLPKLVSKEPQYILLVAGSGEYVEQTRASIKATGMEDHVVLLGRVSDEMLQHLYNGADVFVMPNIHVENDMEGFGRVLLEASLCELPVVATGIEGIRDAIMDGKNGILTEEKNDHAFTEAILDLFDNHKLASFGESSRLYTLENYNWETIALQVKEQYKALSKRGTQ